MKTTTWSLSRRLTLSIMAFQAFTLLAVACVALAIALKAEIDGNAISPQLVSSVAESVKNGKDGAIDIVPTDRLRRFMSESSGLWIVVTATGKKPFFYGPVPTQTSVFLSDLGDLKTIDIKGSQPGSHLTSRFEKQSSAAGPVQIWAGGGAFITDGQAILLIGGIVTAIPIAILLTMTAIGLPLVVKSSLRSMRVISAQIDKVDYEARGTRIEVSSLPAEIYPLVSGLNEALRRIDSGAEATERFFVNAAHELRTPVAILQVRVDGLEPGPETDKIRMVVRRLAALANQLLAFETFRQASMKKERVNLAQLVAGSVGDLAPYALAEGYTISLDAPERPVWVSGDKAALDRMFVNLIQNSIQHGGKSGAISVRVTERSTVEIDDEGPGIPEDKSEMIFEAFYRINAHGSGSGLGLKMVRDIAREHGGDVVLRRRSSAGSRFIVSLPPAA